MQNIVVIFGGKSTEHDVSILTGLHLAKHVTDAYHVTLVYLTRDNHFVKGSWHVDDYISGKINHAKKFTAWHKVSCVVNCCHGGAGEDGTLAAFCKLYNLPITSSAPLSASLGQSKIATREILTMHGFTQPRFQIVRNCDVEQIKLPFPLVVKPDSQGSSIGVAVVQNRIELATALQTALSLDQRAIVEECITPLQEINVAVMCHQGALVTSALELVGDQQFYSFEAKYCGNVTNVPKKVSGNTDQGVLSKYAAEIKKQALTAYQLLGFSGVVRFDFIVQDEKIILNEANTVPGFMAYHLWQQVDIPYGVVISNLINEAIARQQNSQFITNFPSEILIKNRDLVVEI